MFLNSHSWFSLRYGTIAPERLADIAVAHGIRNMVMTDINNTSAAYQFIRSCEEKGIKPAIGIEFRRNNGQFLYVGIAKNLTGWAGLCSFLTTSSTEDIILPVCAPEIPETYFIYCSLPKAIEAFREDEYYGIRPEDVHSFYSSPLRKHQDRLVIFSPITFVDHDHWKVHKLLRCIDMNILLSHLEDKDHAPATEIPYTEDHLRNIFHLYPRIISNTERLLDSCSIRLNVGNDNNRKCFTATKEDDQKLLIKLAKSGCIRRYGNNKKAVQRLEAEMKVIMDLGFSAYFLITWDIVKYARTSGYYHIGRGSGANSIVAYCIGITDVDPLELDLYFERFINPHRSSPPDFDIDFSWDERDDVTDYIFKRYGKDHTALLATYNSFKGKSIIRELGKVVGLPATEIQQIIDEPEAKDKHHPFVKHIFKYGRLMEGFPNYLGIHAGGILISERPLYEHTALKLMPKGFNITHFDMYGAEDLELHKFDVLSQRGLGHIKQAIDLIAENQGRVIDVHDVNKIKKDEGVINRLRSGRCIGCFYIESPAMRGLITKLRCDNYTHLVAASSIIRPGVAKSGMMREYIQRSHHPEKIQYLHPVFEKHLSETFGVMVYQEDVMKIVHHFAGLGLDESDVLRRIMSGKKRQSSTFYNLQDKYFANCAARGYSKELTDEVWRQIESFSGYSFCKAHSASYAVESFQSLYLKTYYPIEFMVAVINNFGGFYNTELYIHEARMSGAAIHAPCVNKSFGLTHLYGSDVYIGMGLIKELQHKVIEEIITQRELDGPFRSLDNFVNRVRIESKQLELLIKIGAFRFTGMSNYELMWDKVRVYNKTQQLEVGMPTLFDMEPPAYELPEFEARAKTRIFNEWELLGFPLASPFSLLEEELPPRTMAVDILRHLRRKITMVGYYVAHKPVRTVNGSLMHFYTWIDENGDFFDTVHFPSGMDNARYRGKGCFKLTGKVVEDFGFPSLEVTYMQKLNYIKDERYV